MGASEKHQATYYDPAAEAADTFAVAAAAVALEELEHSWRFDRRQYPTFNAQARTALAAAEPYLKPRVRHEDRHELETLPRGSVILLATGQSAERINGEWFTPSAREPIPVPQAEHFYPVTILHRGPRP